MDSKKIETLKKLRSIGVKSTRFTDDRVLEVEFFERTEPEVLNDMIGETSNYTQSMFDNMTEQERKAVIEKRTNTLLYGSS